MTPVGSICVVVSFCVRVFVCLSACAVVLCSSLFWFVCLLACLLACLFVFVRGCVLCLLAVSFWGVGWAWVILSRQGSSSSSRTPLSGTCPRRRRAAPASSAGGGGRGCQNRGPLLESKQAFLFRPWCKTSWTRWSSLLSLKGKQLSPMRRVKQQPWSPASTKSIRQNDPGGCLTDNFLRKGGEETSLSLPKTAIPSGGMNAGSR